MGLVKFHRLQLGTLSRPLSQPVQEASFVLLGTSCRGERKGNATAKDN